MFLIPLVILIATYLLTFRSISYSEKQFLLEIVIVQNGNQGTIEQVGQMVKASYVNRQKLLQRAKYKSLRMGVLIILAFIICWTPYYIMMIVVVYTDADQEVTIFRQHRMKLFKRNLFQTTDFLESIIFFFGMANSLVNPLIYGLFHLMPKRRKFFNSFQTSQTRTAVGEVSHNLIASNKKLISRIASVEGSAWRKGFIQ